MTATRPVENPFALRPQIEETERWAIVKALAASSKHRQAARLLGISLRTLQYKLRKYGLASRRAA